MKNVTIPTETTDAYVALSNARNAMMQLQSGLSDELQIRVETIFKHIDDAALELGSLIGDKITEELFFNATH